MMKCVSVAAVDLLGEAAAASPANRELSATELVATHYRCIWRALRRFGLAREEADDAAQEVFLIASQKLRCITPGSERAFLFGIAIRIAAKVRIARARQRRSSTDDTAALRSPPDQAPDEQLDRQMRRRLLDDILDDMHPELRAVFVLYELEQLTMAEIAQAMHVPAGTVASRLRRARAQFQARVAALELSQGRLQGDGA